MTIPSKTYDQDWPSLSNTLRPRLFCPPIVSQALFAGKLWDHNHSGSVGRSTVPRNVRSIYKLAAMPQLPPLPAQKSSQATEVFSQVLSAKQAPAGYHGP